ncbi:hypothetical protein A6A04_08185 [Paramagnetospirillum marisnigri]|uniref:Uncharacterized protein n=1 Tax=Paramagnetospirillum marisnigri TaxID=1285242 RepID=A0A178M8C8_9PROT|nr:hypothetical protein [Paramagnetospirillum marisnigri]OAN44786.1 hypothetical protein A6A04_08185 [Paramagnetospirillum marisnigri]
MKILAFSLALTVLAATASPSWAAAPAPSPSPTPATPSGPVQASVSVENYALVERAPVRNGFSPFSIEATGLLPAPRKRENFTPTEDEHFYTLRRTVERFLQRKEVAVGWSRSNDATIAFSSELSRLRNADGIAYAVEGEMVVRGNSPLPLGLSLTAPADGPVMRYSAGLIIADQVVLMREGVLEPGSRKAGWMVSLRPSGEDAAIPVRAVFAVRAEGSDSEANRKALAAVSALLTSSSDGRAAVAERPTDASEWLKPMKVFVRPGQIPGAAAAPAKGDKKKPEGGAKH